MESLSVPRSRSVDAAVILGSGLAGVFDDGELETIGEIPTSVEGHRGRIALWRFGAARVLVAVGRRHLYEGIAASEAAATVSMASELGARRLVVTNAAGGLSPRLRVGDIMLIDGINALLLGRRVPLLHFGAGSERRGVSGNDVRLDGDELFDSNGPFDGDELRTVAERALAMGVGLEQGTYAAVLGPSYETRAEIRMLRRMGADAVGMSTVPEITAAHGLGMRVTGLSLITNTLSDTAGQVLDHSEVVLAGMNAKRAMRVAIEAALAIEARLA